MKKKKPMKRRRKEEKDGNVNEKLYFYVKVFKFSAKRHNYFSSKLMVGKATHKIKVIHRKVS